MCEFSSIILLQASCRSQSILVRHSFVLRQNPAWNTVARQVFFTQYAVKFAKKHADTLVRTGSKAILQKQGCQKNKHLCHIIVWYKCLFHKMINCAAMKSFCFKQYRTSFVRHCLYFFRFCRAFGSFG